MASVFKRPGSKFWQLKYTDRNGRVRKQSSRMTDKAAASRRSHQLEVREREVRVGIVSPTAEAVEAASRTPIERHVEEYIAADRANGLAARRIQMKRSQLLRFIDRTGIRSIRQIDARAVESFMRSATQVGFPPASDGRFRGGGELVARSEPRPVSPATANEIRATILSFLNWLVAERRLAALPFPARAVRKLNSALDRRKRRRALRPEGVELLLQAVDGQPRGDVYRLALLTGLRRSEIARLQWGDVVLDGAEPHLRLRAETTKAKREDEVPLHEEIVLLLRRLRSGASGGNGPVFPEIPSTQQLYRDLAAAGIQQVSGRKPVPNASGETVDFHSLRRTFGTDLARAGVAPLQMKRLMRHRDLRTTDAYYTDLRLSDQAVELRKLRLGSGAAGLRTKVRPRAMRDGTTGCETVLVDLPQTPTAPRSEARSSAGLGDEVRGGASKRVKGLEPSTFTLATCPRPAVSPQETRDLPATAHQSAHSLDASDPRGASIDRLRVLCEQLPPSSVSALVAVAESVVLASAGRG